MNSQNTSRDNFRYFNSVTILEEKILKDLFKVTKHFAVQISLGNQNFMVLEMGTNHWRFP